MRRPHWFTAAAVAAGAVTVVLATLSLAQDPRPRAFDRPELEYLKVVNRVAPPRDPQLVMLLMGQFANAGRSREGAEFFAGLTRKFSPQLDDGRKALYLSATALLRARAAPEISVLNRIGWVKDSVAMLDQAHELTHGEVFVVRWISGVVRAQLPGFFGQRDRALQDLRWCLEHADGAPQQGWLPEVRYQLAALERGEKADKPITLVTPFAEDPENGHTFSARRIAEVVPGRVYALSGFEFTEYYFVVSDDARELIAIDAGTRPDSAKTAYEALRAAYPKLPPLTTVLVTHAHWDHVGGHGYFEGLEPKPRFIARSNYADEIANDLKGPHALLKHFFGSRFDLEQLKSFRPGATVERRTELKLGGTRFELIPIEGGETHDGLFIHLPQLGVLFAGDFIMPYLGAPFIEEGDFDGLLAAIDLAKDLNPRILLHGHEPLTQLFNSVAMLADTKEQLVWLREQVRAGIANGVERAALQQANLIPPRLLTDHPATHLAYLVLRENVINRLYDQSVGYWQTDLAGMDYVSRADRGSALVDYLGLSDRELAAAAERMIRDGKHELAAQLVDAARERLPQSAELARVHRLAYLKLKEKYADSNPFKFIVYNSRLGDEAAR